MIISSPGSGPETVRASAETKKKLMEFVTLSTITTFKKGINSNVDGTIQSPISGTNDPINAKMLITLSKDLELVTGHNFNYYK